MNQFNPNSPRAKEAKLRNTMDKFETPFFFVLGLMTVSALYLLLYYKNSLGWIAVGVASVILMLDAWTRWRLRHIPLGKTDDINDLLSGDAMTVLGKDQGMLALMEGLLMHTKSGKFMAMRLGIARPVLSDLLQEKQLDMERVFQRARGVREQNNSKQIGGGDLLIAMLLECDNAEQTLGRHKLEVEDFYETMRWFNYLNNLSRIEQAPKRAGGIARDLNFGYIPTLQHYGRNISDKVSHASRSQVRYTNRGDALDKMIQIFSGNAKQNVALIGPEGSGRSLLVKAFAEELLDESSDIPHSLKYRQIFQLDASALLAATDGGKNLEGLLTKIFNEAYAAKNIILYFNDANLFFGEGTGAVDITNFLMPIIEAGNMRIILSIEEQEFLKLSARGSGVANMFNRVNIAPTDKDSTMKTMEDQVPVFEGRFNVIYMFDAMKEAYRLGDRYVNDRAEPGRALKMLELAASYADGYGKHKFVMSESVQRAVEHSLGVKVRLADNAESKEKLLNMEELIHQRMVDQVDAVKTVSSALRRAAAGVRNEKRPIGAFLFLGPTGVGKTELAKAVSEVYFNGESQIARLDLNEFVKPGDVGRLIADGATDEMSLTAQVMKRPFSVVLLDEIEKAHPQVLTALLQVLDEGMLRDIKNKEVSFRDTIIIATSNAGADLVRKYVSEGMDLKQAKEKILDHLIETGEFKPEFLNRFDEVCMFTPLGKDDLLKVVDLMLKGTNKTLENQKVAVKLTQAAKELLVEKGYDLQMGARPMRRMIQKTVENIVANEILKGNASAGTEVEVTEDMVREAIDK